MVGNVPAGVWALPESLSVKDRLLRAGIIAFAQKGFHGARIEDIISQAGVNVRMVYHYFGSKDGLYDEAVQSAATALMRTAIVASKDVSVPILARLEQAVKAYCEASLARPDYACLISWEASRGGVTLSRVVPSEESAEKIFGDLLAEAVRSGAITRPIDQKMTVVGLVSAPSFLSHPILRTSGSSDGEVEARRTADAFWSLIAGALGI